MAASLLATSHPAVRHEIRELDAYVPGLSIAEIQEKYHLPRVIKMASNENPLGTPPLAREAILRHAASAFRYPQGGNPRLVRALAARHHVAPERIFIANGSDEVIDLLLRVLAVPGRHNVVCFAPCFGLYPIQAAINGLETRRPPLADDFSFDLTALLAQVDDNTRLVFLTTPDNPSGYCPPRSVVADFADRLAVKAPHCLLVIDEAYMDMAPDEAAASLLAAACVPDNAIILRTFSKSLGLAGMRIGYAVTPGDLASYLWRTRLPFSVNILAEEAALAALEDVDFFAATQEAVRTGRQRLTEGLTRLGCTVWPSAANFLMFRLPQGSLGAAACFTALLEQGIIIRRLTSYALPQHLRVSVGTAEENGLFLEALAAILGMKP